MSRTPSRPRAGPIEDSGDRRPQWSRGQLVRCTCSVRHPDVVTDRRSYRDLPYLWPDGHQCVAKFVRAERTGRRPRSDGPLQETTVRLPPTLITRARERGPLSEVVTTALEAHLDDG